MHGFKGAAKLRKRLMKTLSVIKETATGAEGGAGGNGRRSPMMIGEPEEKRQKLE